MISDYKILKTLEEYLRALQNIEGIWRLPKSDEGY
jgi:hypothetical protein